MMEDERADNDSPPPPSSPPKFLDSDSVPLFVVVGVSAAEDANEAPVALFGLASAAPESRETDDSSLIAAMKKTSPSRKKDYLSDLCLEKMRQSVKCNDTL